MEESKDLCAFFPERLEVLEQRKHGGEVSWRYLPAGWLNSGCGFLLPGFNLNRRQKLDFFSKYGVSRWVKFRLDMEAPPAARVAILSPPY